MNLVIVESPTKSRTLSKFLGKDYKIVASKGHVRDLPKSKLGIDEENDFEPHYILLPKARKTVKELKKEIKEADSVILGTDEDREGEAIAWHLTKALDLEEFKRIVFHEITKGAIEKALESPRDIDMNLVDAQQARRVLDRLVGYKLSPFLWKKVARGLSAGRVQSVAVRLIVEREREIEDFDPQEYWSIEAELQPKKNNESLKAKLNKQDNKKIPKLGIKSEEEADEIVKDLEEANYQITNVKKKEKKKKPFPPFTTSSLLRDAGIKLKFSSNFTMRLAQSLYESGHITYHRTDSLNVSSQALSQVKKFISSEYGKNYLKIRKYRSKGKAQEAHEAIRPTFVEKTPKKLKEKLKKSEFKLYKLIWERFVSSQMKPAVFDSTRIDIKASPEEEKFPSGKETYDLRATGSILKFDGFSKVYPINFKQAELPEVKEEETLKLLELNPEQHFTKAPPRYSEATLIKALKKKDIGRPSTYAPIISTIKKRNYARVENKRFHPTEIGTVVNDLLVEHFPRIVDVNFTAEMEENLDKVADGKKEWIKIIEDFYGEFIKNLEKKYDEVSKKDIAEEKTDKKCPECGSPLLIKLGKFGKFYACSNFPKCKYTEPLEENKIDIECPKCKEGKIVEKRTKKGKVFYGCDRYPDCDFAVWNKPHITEENEKKKPHFCPKCDSLLVETKKYIKCSKKECDYKKKKENK